MGYAFISYSSKDQSAADALRDLLNSKGIDTWMAPGDIPAGSSYMKEINCALKNCSCLVLLLSNAAQGSSWVIKEVERAVNYHKQIIPVQIEDVILNDEFEFVLGSFQVVAVQRIDQNSNETKKILNSIITSTGTRQESNQEDTKDIFLSQQENEGDKKPGKKEEKETINCVTNESQNSKSRNSINVLPRKNPSRRLFGILFGEYYIDSNIMTDPIEWLVLDHSGDKMLVISKLALDYLPYGNPDSEAVWETCSLRRWLNHDFFEKAFNADERARIIETDLSKIDNIKVPNHSTYTSDRIFLLSDLEVARYIPSHNLLCHETEWSRKKHGEKRDVSCDWWLRTKGYRFNLAKFVSNDGAVDDYGENICYNKKGVRPAMWIKASV